MKSLSAQFADWVGQQDPEARYNYCDASACALARFGLEMGYPHLVDNPQASMQFGPKVWDALNPGIAGIDPCGGASTYGALASRLTPLPAPKAETVPA